MLCVWRKLAWKSIISIHFFYELKKFINLKKETVRQVGNIVKVGNIEIHFSSIRNKQLIK